MSGIFGGESGLKIFSKKFYKSAIPHNADTALDLSSPDVDTMGGAFSTYFVAPEDGHYLVSVTVGFIYLADGVKVECDITRSGSTQRTLIFRCDHGGGTTAQTTETLSGSEIVSMTKGQNIFITLNDRDAVSGGTYNAFGNVTIEKIA